MRKFQYSFLINEGIRYQLFNLSAIISDLSYKASSHKKKRQSLFASLEKRASIDSVLGSSAIEGVVTTRDRGIGLVEGKLEPISHNEEQIAGYKEALLFIKEHYAEIPFNVETILKLHSLLLGPKGGQFKKVSNLIAELNPDGSKKRVVFVPASPEESPEAMEELVTAYLLARSDERVPVSLLIPSVILDFLCIHPFQDGNGRISRLLTVLLLLKEGVDVGRYISYENEINETKYEYYAALEESSRGWEENKNDYNPFLIYHFQILYRCYKKLNERLLEGKGGKQTKKARIEAVLEESIVPLSKKEIMDYVPDASETTVEAVLGALLKAGIIIKIGSFQNAKYMKNPSSKS